MTYLLKMLRSVFHFSVFWFSVLLSVALDSKCGLYNVFPTLDRHRVTVQKLLGLHQCSSVKANVTVPPFPVLKSAKMWTKWLIAHWCWSSSSAVEHTSDRCVVRPAKDTDLRKARESALSFHRGNVSITESHPEEEDWCPCKCITLWKT